MRRSLLLFLLAAGCCLIASCGAKNGRGEGAAAKGEGANAPAAASKPSKTDVVFAREAVEALLGGDTNAAAAFDWENLKVPGAADAGAAYSELPDDENRAEFQKGFIEKFSESFKQSGATTSDLKNWREAGREGERTVVAADTTTGKTMRVVVTRREGRQLISELAID